MTIVEAVIEAFGAESPLFCETVADLGWPPMQLPVESGEGGNEPATQPLQRVGA